MHLYSLLLLCCAMLVSECRRMHKRSVNCTDGTYPHEGKTCCLCPKGYRLLSHCTDKDQTKCELCESDTFMDHPNSEQNCLLCGTCSANANMEMKEKCSLSSNIVCKCRKDHYCDKGEHCKACKPCDTCPNGEKTKCTDTSNTVCSDATPISSGAIAGIVLGVIITIIVIGGVLFYIRRRNKKRKPLDTVLEQEEPLKDLDISTYLPEIGECLSWNVMKRVAQQSGMNAATIDNHETSHPTNVKERTYELFLDWHQEQGLYKAYPALIKSLGAINERRRADEIKEIVKKGEAKAQI